jgi:hypothetical protein
MEGQIMVIDHGADEAVSYREDLEEQNLVYYKVETY